MHRILKVRLIMRTKKKKPSLLTEQDLFNFEQLEWALNQNEEDSVSQCCLRYGYGNMPEEYLLDSCQRAFSALCKDNPDMNADKFTSWYQQLIEDKDVFRFDKVMLNTVKEVRILFDKKTEEWMEKGLMASHYDTEFCFWGIIGMATYTLSYRIREKYDQLNNDAFFKNPLFGKYKIIALDYADEGTLNDFQNPHGYNRFDIEAILYYIIDRYDAFGEYYKYRDIYNEVKAIVYEEPCRKLIDTKAKLEQLASSSEKKFQYAMLYACAVIEWYLRNH